MFIQVCKVGEGRESMLVEIVDDIEDGADDGDRVVLGKLAFCEDAVKEILSGCKLKAEVVLCALKQSLS